MDMVSKPLCSHQACPLCYLFPLTHFKSNFLSHAFLSLTACLEFFFNLAVKAILPFYFFFSQPAWQSHLQVILHAKSIFFMPHLELVQWSSTLTLKVGEK